MLTFCFCIDRDSGKHILSIAIYYCGDGLLGDIKALSPVIAAVILVAVAVAVSLSAAFWTGRLTLGFMHAEDLRVVGHCWASDFSFIELKLKNSGADSVRVDEVWVGSEPVEAVFVSGTNPLEPGDVAVLRVSYGFVEGETYKFFFVTARGNRFFYMATAES